MIADASAAALIDAPSRWVAGAVRPVSAHRTRKYAAAADSHTQ
jgi:hypothetical protein